MAAKNDMNFPIFDDKDYTNWKIRIYKFLQFKKCKVVVMRENSNRQRRLERKRY
jgi:hypothetical protein